MYVGRYVADTDTVHCQPKRRLNSPKKRPLKRFSGFILENILMASGVFELIMQRKAKNVIKKSKGSNNRKKVFPPLNFFVEGF
jgi:hypothetical protein